MKLLLGTNNPSKLNGMRRMIEAVAPRVECVSPAELGVADIQPAEDDATAMGNAILKALTWHAATGLSVIAEDSGLIFPDLPADHPDQPGVRVRRMNGSDWMDDETMLAWYTAIAHRHGGKLRAAWQDAWCIVDQTGGVHRYMAPDELLNTYAFLLVDTPCAARVTGWPLNSISIHPELGGKYKAELTDLDSHQLAALRSTAAAEEQRRHEAWIVKVLTGAE